MSRGRRKPSLRDITRQTASGEDVKAVLEHAIGFLTTAQVPVGTDRVIAITMAAHLERLVKDSIWGALKNRDEKTMERLHSEHGPLSTFSANIEMAYALGSIDAVMMDELNRVRLIRNAFAHAAVDITFDTPLVAKECKKLKALRFFAAEDPEIETLDKEMTPRQRFIFLATFLSAVILKKNLSHAMMQLRERKPDIDPSYSASIDRVIAKIQGMWDFPAQFKALRAKSTAASSGSL